MRTVTGNRRPAAADGSGSAPDPRRLVEEYGRMVSALCRRMIRDPERARDAAQEVWLQVLRSLPSFAGRSRLSTWIYTIARRVISRQARKERLYSTRFLSGYFRRPEEVEVPPGVADERLWIRQQCDQCLVGILHCLDNRARLAYLFRDLAGLAYGEIADVLSMEEPAVRQLVCRSRARLRRFLNDECFLFNPRGSCNCRMKPHLQRIDLAAEYARIRRSVRTVEFLRASEQALPRANDWENLLA
jgi:RNA polymerase sigma-70 factor (ECF subfamily)